ncbi:subtilisin-like serine protease [Ceratobasidium sp. 370]|nr:subtilisin-like serine protease [Ceratobasidium sp. 370]
MLVRAAEAMRIPHRSYNTPCSTSIVTIISSRIFWAFMRGLSSYFVTALAAVLTHGGGVTAVSVTMSMGEVKPSSYIVMLNDRANMTSHKNWIDGERAKLSKRNPKSNFKITNSYDILNGYSAQLTNDTLAELAKSPDVAMIVQDSRCEGSLTQYNAPWGISRISRKTRLPAGSSSNNVNYRFYHKGTRPGVDVYVIDSGVNIAHVDFGGRAKWGCTCGGYKDEDGHGHGTHVAGTIAGKRYGVAKAASIIAVRVLDDAKEGWASDEICGVEWATKQALATGRPSVLNISISGRSNAGVDHAVTKAVAKGIHVVVAAGNSNKDAKDFSPARAPAVITVGATNIKDERWVRTTDEGSNFGAGVDIWAPGEYIPSTWIGSTTATNIYYGTSMAAPHVSGLIAYLLALEGRRTPANMRARIKQLAPDGILRGIPPGTRNEIIWNGGA